MQLNAMHSHAMTRARRASQTAASVTSWCKIDSASEMQSAAALEEGLWLVHAAHKVGLNDSWNADASLNHDLSTHQH